jgi:hypothetical protein
MLCSPTQRWLYSLTWKHQPLFCTHSFIPFFFPSSYAFCHTFIPEHDCTLLHCFLQKLYTYSQLRNLLLVCWCTAYCNVLVGSISQWSFIALKIQYTTVNYNTSNTRMTSTGSLTNSQVTITTVASNLFQSQASTAPWRLSSSSSLAQLTKLLLNLSLIYSTLPFP